MDLYLAGVKTIWGYIKEPDEERALQEYIDGINMLESFYYADEWTERVIPRVNKFLLDSGAFTFFGSGKQIDWEDYLRRYADFINRNDVDLFFELDIDRIVGYEKVLQFRESLESMTGKKCIPVWHRERGQQEFVKMCEDYDYVAIGGVAKNPDGKRITQYYPWFIQTAHKHGAKIHGLGYTSTKKLAEYHFDSVDSTSWLAGNQYGHLYKFDGKNMRQISAGSGRRIASARAAMRNNFCEWVKFQKYASIHY